VKTTQRMVKTVVKTTTTETVTTWEDFPQVSDWSEPVTAETVPGDLEYDAEGFAPDGFDSEGFDRDGFDSEGFDSSGFDRDGFDRDGFDYLGLNRDGELPKRKRK
jgi:hypothetical protein